MIRKYHNHKLQTNPWHRKEDPHSNQKTPGYYAPLDLFMYEHSVIQLTFMVSGKVACGVDKRVLVALYRGSYMSAHVLLNLLNKLGKRDKMRGLPRILSLFRNEFNKFNNTRARMLDSIYHMTNSLKSHFWRKNVIILSLCTQRCYGRHNVSRKSINH